jgi:hypothetical protein
LVGVAALSGRESSVAEIDEKVMSFVEDTLAERPGIELADLYEEAQKVSPAVKDLSKRQFNARYPLQVKRRRSQALRANSGPKTSTSRPATRRGRPRAGGGDQPARESVRKVLLQFATDIAGAEERKDLVRVLSNVDRYVDQVLKGAVKA